MHAHCESGVTTNLLKHYGIHMTEPLAFGIGAGLFFTHIPFVKVNGVPGTSYRSYPGTIFKTLMKSLNIQYEMQQFGNNQEKGQKALDDLLDRGIPVGLLSGIFYLTYMPEAYRFQFNAHNLIAYGKNEAGNYLISDPTLEGLHEIAPADLQKSRFAKGFPEPKGKLYYITNVPQQLDMEAAIRKGIKKNIWLYTSPPIGLFGNKAIHTLANRLEHYPDKLTDRQAVLYVGNIIRMQEEIGTGGGGFRFLYAAFLQEAAQILGKPELKEFSQRMTAIGDAWRNFAYSAARICKARTSDLVSYKDLSKMLHEIGHQEKAFFMDLKKVNL
ncbi:peptidase [Taibaiella sp. KBW10]|nr:peptidase [Taibaiella sp. KBW10]